MAEDVTSDIFLKAYTAIGNYREEGSFRSWLFSIAHNTVTDFFRTQRTEEPIELAVQMQDLSPGPERTAELADSDRVVRELLATLTPQQARIIELRLAGLSGPEIARIVGCSLAAVKIGQYRGYTRLRESLSRDGQHEGGPHDR